MDIIMIIGIFFGFLGGVLGGFIMYPFSKTKQEEKYRIIEEKLNEHRETTRRNG